MKFPPFLHSWSTIGLAYVDELHLILCTGDSVDPANVLGGILVATHDFQALRRAVPMLQDSWRRYLRRKDSPAVEVVSLLRKLAAREVQCRRSPEEIHEQGLGFYDSFDEEYTLAKHDAVQRLQEGHAMFLEDMDTAGQCFPFSLGGGLVVP